MRPDPETVDGVALVVEGQDGVLVDVVGGDDHQLGEPGHAELGGDAFESLAG